jgi:YVTN family beta-propeller protein
MTGRFAKFFVFMLIAVFVVTATNLVNAQTVTATINVGTSPTGVAYDQGKGEIFVANSGFNTISVISDDTNAVIKTVTVGTSPTGIAYDSGKGEVFITNHGSNSVSVVSDTSLAVVATVPVGTSPNNLAYDSAKNEIFVVNSGDNSVSVISDSTNAVIATIPVGTNPNKIIFDSGKGELFVCNSGFNTVSVISDNTNAVITTITVGISPAGAAYDSALGEIFVANYGSGQNTVSVISDSTNQVVATIPVGTTPYGIAYDSGTSEIYVSNHGSNTVSVISDSTNAVVATIPVGTTPSGAVYDSVKGKIFVTNLGANSVSVISDSSSPASPIPSSSASSSPAIASSPTSIASKTPTQIAISSSGPSQTTAPLTLNLSQVWTPKPVNAVAAVGVSALVIGAVSFAFAALDNPLGGLGGKVAEKTSGLIPDHIKEWMQEIISSKRKLNAEGKKGSIFKPTKPEALAYVTSVVILAISFAYVKVSNLDQIWAILPVFFLTSILVGLVQKFFGIVFMRSRGVWSEHKVWPLGLILFLFSTFALRVPFSSPTRNAHQSTESAERLGAIVSASEILISLAFAGIFSLLLIARYTDLGGAGLAMCVIGSFCGTFPMTPLSGKDIYDHSKRLWAALFIVTSIIFIVWLLLM